MEFHFWPSVEITFPTPMLLKSTFSTFCHIKFVYDTGNNNNIDILLRTHGSYHRHKSTKSG